MNESTKQRNIHERQIPATTMNTTQPFNFIFLYHTHISMTPKENEALKKLLRRVATKLGRV